MTDTQSKWQKLRGDGAKQACTANQLTSLKDEFRQLCKDAGHAVNDRREYAEATRRCVWAGQHPDGKKHDDPENGINAFPFNGASDARVREADAIIDEQVIILMAALMRQQTGFKAFNRNRDDFASKWSTVWEWVLKNQLGAEWITEWTKFAQWRQGDSPAVGIMQVYWHQQRQLRKVEVTADDVLERVLEVARGAQMELTPEDSADLQDIAVNPDRAEEFAGLLQALWPDLPDKRAATVARELQEDGESEFLYPYICENRLRLKARRLFDDIFIPENTTDIHRARVIFVREWFTKTELEEMDAAGDFKPGFVDEVLKHEGESGWTHYSHYNNSGVYHQGAITRDWDKSRQRGHYELITAFFRATNADGIPGVFTVQFNFHVDLPGTDVDLLDYKLKNGRYPFALSPREIKTETLWESRGIAELSATDQHSLKLLHDSFMDNVQLGTVPPFEVPASRPKMALVFGPLKQIRVNRPGEIKKIDMGTYPQGNDRIQALIRESVDKFYGRMSSKTNTPDWVRLYGQSLVDFFLIPVAEVVAMGGALCQQFMDDETIARVSGEDGEPIARSVEEIEGQFDVEVSFEAGMLSFEFLKMVGEMITNYVMKWDRSMAIDTDELVRWFFGALSSSLAKRIVRPVEVANQEQIDIAEKNFAKIAVGIEPPMPLDGQNFALQLETILGIGQKNPEAFAKLTPVSKDILAAHIKYLQGQVEQQKNAVIGRTMAAPALPEDAAAAGA